MALSGVGLPWSEAAGPWYWPVIGWASDDAGSLVLFVFIPLFIYLVCLNFFLGGTNSTMYHAMYHLQWVAVGNGFLQWFSNSICQLVDLVGIMF